ncbi:MULTISPECIES: homoserine kinase [unclassified Pseudoalteromonas]|uniref:homoserine kinase n=1 Tax=unclassified Pseudoalteromonas TaxID=194690 RepID=UPI000C0797BD|nr:MULTISPECIES: homoserine kinase [unclassified Pseudoalteromonas]MDP2634408.1 homoserine kinase [Pseudoalteromonas sp. 1_MG-2023]PHN89306.1 homoserine kinase [Pseudoalteromonas sp. 3D05]
MIEVYAPASIGNFAVGFDALGAALAPIDGTLLGDVVAVSSASADEFICSGDYAHKLPSDASENLAYQCLVHFREHVAPNMPTVKLELKKNLPIGSGLGSSACSVVATFAALDKFADTKLSQVALIELMADFEAIVSGGRHYDNITPCYLGGLQLTGDLIPDKSLALPVDDSWYYVAAFPGFSLNTAKARSVLPTQLSMHASVEFAQRLSAFSTLLLTNRFDDALSIMSDEIAEPHRAPLISGFSEAKAALPELGAEIVSISGAGPTLFTVCKTLEAAKQCEQWLQSNYLNEQGFCHICKLDSAGARQL